MSRTYKDMPYRIRAKREGRLNPWYWSSPPRWYVQEKFNRPERHEAKRLLKQGIEPFPHQSRHRAWWDWW